jgi:hypothetical protein
VTSHNNRAVLELLMLGALPSFTNPDDDGKTPLHKAVCLGLHADCWPCMCGA